MKMTMNKDMTMIMNKIIKENKINIYSTITFIFEKYKFNK